MNVRRVTRLTPLLAFLLAGYAVAAVAGGCSGDEGSLFGNGVDAGGDPDAARPPDFGGDPDAASDARGCVNLECKQVACPGGGATTITGKVFDPAGVNALYNALVYIPNGTVQPFDDEAGITCDRCGAFASGSPLVSAVTAPDGSFTLTNVPVGVDLPLVIQLGKWRRVVTIPAATACVANPITDVGLTRLPRKSSEGHLPRMAIATGGADPFECLLRKIGIDDSEFSLPSGTGRIHYFKAEGGPDFGLADAGAPPTSALWGSVDTLKKYDVVLFPCEGTPDNSAKDAGNDQTPQGYANVENYVDLGGRVFTTHYSYTWMRFAPQPFPSVAQWDQNENDRADKANAADTLITRIDNSFPKGQAFSDWLVNVDASVEAGKLPVVEWRHDVKSENKPPSQGWIYADTRTAWNSDAAATAAGAGPVTQHFTFNAPIEAGVDDAGQPLQCGKVVFSDFHVSAGERKAGTFPSECRMNPMSPQEKALEFMLFDLSACIQNEDAPVVPPAVPK